LLVEHHTYFKNGYEKIKECVTQINSLSKNLRWTNLEDLIRNTYLQRTISSEEIECQIFTNYQVIFNKESVEKKYIIRKNEDGVVPVKKVFINGKNYPYRIEEKNINIYVDVPSKSSIEIIILYENMYKHKREKRDIRSDMKVYIRRYLSEFRDNYIHRSETLLNLLYIVKNRLF
jgi:predicted DNA-binding ribbon-helix-helix protein